MSTPQSGQQGGAVSAPELDAELVRRLRDLRAVKRGALAMFSPMLEAVAEAPSDPRFAEVTDLLGRMRGAFTAHRDRTAEHVTRLDRALAALGASPASGRERVASVGARLRARLALRGGMDFGAAASEAFVFEHLEIAAASLIVEIARRAEHEAVVREVEAIRDDDRDQAATIERNLTNVTSLALASRRLPTRRPPEGD